MRVSIWIVKLIEKSPLKLWLILFIFRIINSLIVTTLLFPDEWWQFGEAAHVAVYKFGYLTWDWRAGIRSWIGLVPLMGLLQCSKWLGSIGIFGLKEEDWIARNGDRIISAGWLALTDLFTIKLSGRIFGRVSVPYALLFSVSSSFHASRSIRSLSNNVEMALSVVALYYWPFKGSKGKFRLALGLVGWACLIRITSLLFWAWPMISILPVISWKDQLVMAPLIATLTIFIGIVVDSYFYEKFTISWWNFLQWNVIKGISGQYGKEVWHFHLSKTLPLMVNTMGIYLIRGIWCFNDSKQIQIFLISGIYLVLSSLQGHKETRFLAPIYPLLIIFAAHGAQQLSVITRKNKFKIFPKWMNSILLIFVALSQIPIAWFYTRIHFTGAYNIVDKLRNRIDQSINPSSAYFLVPCHVTPYLGYLHRELKMSGFLKCHPKQVDHLMPLKDSIDRDEFARDPIGFVRENVLGVGYEHVLLFEGDLSKYSQMFDEFGYVECERSKNSSFLALGSNRARGDLLIYCKKKNKSQG